MPNPSFADSRETHATYATRADAARCRAMLRGGSRSFFAASLLLPKSVREAATGLYAFCRMADDAIDQGTERRRALDELRERLARIYAGNPNDLPADRAFADLVVRFRIPKAFPVALLEGFEWDASDRRYENLSQLKAYCVRVAGTVGGMMAMLMRVKDLSLIARACELGVAMQLTNIARDVGEDARLGRLYLPLEWLRAANIDPDSWLAQPRFDLRLGALIRRLLETADGLYARADGGIARLPAACRPGMQAARLLYAEIGRELMRRNYDSVNARAIVPWQRKALILAQALRAASRDAGANTNADAADAPHEAQFLLAAMAQATPLGARPGTCGLPAPLALAPRKRIRWPRLEDRVIWLIDLFERLERRERSLAPGVNAS